MGVWGRSPQRGSREKNPWWGSGANLPLAGEVVVFKAFIFDVYLL